MANITAGAIAKELQFSDAKVKKALIEIGIEPIVKKDACKLNLLAIKR